MANNKLLVELLLMAEELGETVFVPLGVRLDKIVALELVLLLVVLSDELKVELTV